MPCTKLLVCEAGAFCHGSPASTLLAAITFAFIAFTAPDGSTVWVDATDAHVIIRSRPAAALWDKRACSVVTVHDTTFAVRECPREVMEMIDGARK